MNNDETLYTPSSFRQRPNSLASIKSVKSSSSTFLEPVSPGNFPTAGEFVNSNKTYYHQVQPFNTVIPSIQRGEPESKQITETPQLFNQSQAPFTNCIQSYDGHSCPCNFRSFNAYPSTNSWDYPSFRFMNDNHSYGWNDPLYYWKIPETKKRTIKGIFHEKFQKLVQSIK